jgi:aspartate kinase
VGFSLPVEGKGETMKDSSGASSDSPGSPGIVVMKFGGTSVEDAHAIRRVVRIVRSRLNFRAVVVVSALAGVTDELLRLGRVAEKGELFQPGVAELQARHEQIARDLLAEEAYQRLCADFAKEFADLAALLCEVAAAGKLSLRLQDRLLGFGECLSSQLVTATLAQDRVEAVLVDSRSCIVTDEHHTQASPLLVESNWRLQQTLHPILDKRYVPVLGGFLGASKSGVPTTLGRGGSDLSATIVGAALHACRVEIWTDVDGVMSADPNLCPDARLIRKMSFDEAAELAHFGARVLHPATLFPVAKKNIPVYVLNSRTPDLGGTEIVAHCQSGGGVRAVTAKRSIAAVEIACLATLDTDFLQDIYSAFERHHCAVELMSWSHGKASLLVSSTAALPSVAAELQHKASLRWENHKALICLVGENIRRQPEIASQVFAAVSDIDVRMVCQSASDRTISFLVDESRAEESVQRLHGLFFPARKQPCAAPSSKSLCQAGEAWL